MPRMIASAMKLTSVLAVFLSLAGCQQSLQQLNRDLAAANANRPGAMASATPASKEQQTKLTVPTDQRTREAMEAALPAIKKILSIHQCIKVTDGMLQLNHMAVPGVSFAGAWNLYPNNAYFMKYHDRNNCVSVRAIDNWAMPALNALQFRAVYFAEDSGETINFSYLMKKVDDGSWKLQTIERAN